MKDLLAPVACFFALATFWLGCPQPRAAQSPPAPLKIAPVLSKRFYDPKNDSYIRYKDGIYIALTKDGTLKTVVRGPISKRWQPL